MATITGSALRTIQGQSHEIIVVLLFVDVSQNRSLSSADIYQHIIDNYAGSTITVSGRTDTRLSNYNPSVVSFNDTAGNITITQSVWTNQYIGTEIINLIYVKLNNTLLTAPGVYSIGSYENPPRTEMAPLVIFADESTGELLTPPNNAYDQWFSGGSNLVLAENDQVYNLLIDPAYRQRGGPRTFTLGASTTVNYEDVTQRVATPDDDPYLPGGISGPGGGEGDFDWSSDPIDFPPLPTLSATDTGFLTLFNPTVEELQSFANYVWNDLSIDNFHKVFNNPMDAILGLSIVPVAVPDGGRRAVTVGNLFAVDIVMNMAASQYVEVDCGTIFVKKEYDGYLDYDPYTKSDIYLPYIGIRPLKTDDIMGKNIHVKYHIDILSGACCAYVKCGNALMYSFVGQCSASVPITGGDWTNVINGVLQMAAAIGSMVATEGAAAPFVAGQLIQGASAASKPQIEKSGGMSGTGGMMAYQKPYLIRTIPRQALPDDQNKYTGYPSMITMKLSSCSGYTEIEAINLEGLTATAEEMTEIENLLKGGVYF